VVTAHNAMGGGACFRVRVPMDPPGSSAPRPTGGAPTPHALGSASGALILAESPGLGRPQGSS